MDDPKVTAAVITGGCTIVAAVVAIVGKLVLAAIGRLLGRLESVEHEVKPNDGNSSHDKVMAVLATLTTEMGGLRDDVRADRDANAREHAQLRKADNQIHRRIDGLHPPGGGTGTTNPQRREPS